MCRSTSFSPAVFQLRRAVGQNRAGSVDLPAAANWRVSDIDQRNGRPVIEAAGSAGSGERRVTLGTCRTPPRPDRYLSDCTPRWMDLVSPPQIASFFYPLMLEPRCLLAVPPGLILSSAPLHYIPSCRDFSNGVCGPSFYLPTIRPCFAAARPQGRHHGFSIGGASFFSGLKAVVLCQ